MAGKKKVSSMWFVIAAVFALVLCIASVLLMFHAKKLGNIVGETSGELVGKVVGTYTGITKGLDEGKEAGKADGLSAEDTTSTIVGGMQSIGKLRVLSADVVVTNHKKDGGESVNSDEEKNSDKDSKSNDKKTMESVILFYGQLTFTIDLEKCRIYDDGQTLTIYIPEPEHDLRFDHSKTEVITANEKRKAKNSEIDGYTSFINSVIQIKEKTREAILCYDSLLETAKTIGEKELRLLIENMSIDVRQIRIEYLPEGE